MVPTFRRLLLVSAGAVVFSASGTAQVSTEIERAVTSADAAYERDDFAEAVRWYRLAANRGDATSQLNLGFMYDEGKGVPENNVEAARWYRKAAEQGLAIAQSNLGHLYTTGEGVPKSNLAAVRWYRQAADQGYAEAQYNLGVMYDNGEGVPENDAEAVKWYRLAAEQDNADAQLNLGAMYAEGEGVPDNYVEAYKWWSLAAAQGVHSAAGNRDIIRQRMTPAQIAEGQRLAAAWKSSIAEPPSKQQAQPQTAEPAQGSGSGFYVTASGHLVTNAHVVEGCTRITLANGSRLTLVAVDAEADLALLERSGEPATAALSLRQGRGVRLADNVIVAGYPLSGLLSSGLNVTTGTVSALAGIGNDRQRIQITAPVQPGNSGGPLLDQSGNVVGVVVSKLDAVAVASAIGDIPQNVNFAISLGALQAFLDANAVDYLTRNSAVTMSNAEVAERARAATVQVQCRV